MGSLSLSSQELCNHIKRFFHPASVQSGGRLGPPKVSFHGRRRSSFITIRAVSQLQPKCPDHEDQAGDRGFVISCGDVDFAAGLDEKERSRRMKISRANTGIVPWNKGKKHSAETIQKIKERTKLAMQSPKVRMKLMSFSHRQSMETKMKIGAGVRLGWKRRRKKMKVQETCFHEWQNWIAEASRKGLIGGKGLEWNSYEILDEQLEKEWLESVDQRKSRPRPSGGKRAPKSIEQRRRIAEAIAAKWADPAYRERVCSGMANYHCSTVGSERKTRRKPTGKTKSTRQNSSKQTNDGEKVSSKSNNIKKSTVRRSNNLPYKDPLASSKLEMIKNIRSQRKAAESKIAETVEQARLLIAQAEKAAEALEAAVTRSVTAQVSLLETRELIAEALELIKAVEAGEISMEESPTDGSSKGGTDFLGRVGHEKMKHSVTQPSRRTTVDGMRSPLSSIPVNFDFGKFAWEKVRNLEGCFAVSGSGEMNLSREVMQTSVYSDQEEASPGQVRVIKKWVRGKFVEVMDPT